EIAAGNQKPPKLKTPGVEVEKQDSKGKAATAGKIAAGSQKPAPQPNISEVQAKKQDVKGKAQTASGKLAGDKHMAAPQQRSKPPAMEVKKGKGKADADNAGGDEKTTTRSGRQAAPGRKSYRL